MLNAPGKKLRKAPPIRWSVPALVLLASVGLTTFATYYAARSVRLTARQEFDAAVYQAEAAIHARMESYLALLRGGTAFFAGDGNISRKQFHNYVERLRLSTFYPGIQGFGFTARIQTNEIDQVITDARLAGLTNFNIWPIVPGEDIYTIQYIEPLDRRNRAALGFNMYSEPVRRAAMDRARDLGAPVGSGRVTLVQEIEGRVQPGFLIYAPAYKGGEVPPTVAERREALVGYIYAPFRAEDLFRKVVPEEISEVLRIRIFDGETTNSHSLLYSNEGLGKTERRPLDLDFRAKSQLSIAKQPWTMVFEYSGGRPANWYLIPGVIVLGLLVTILLTTLTVSEARAMARAELANVKLTVSERSLQEARERLERHARDLEVRVQERTSRLQESLRDLEAVLYHVAHDLRAPVRAMGSFASILHDDYRQSLDERALGYLDRITEAAQRMDRLVYDLLAYGRMAQMPLTLDAVPLDKSVSTVLSRAADDLQKRAARVEVADPLPIVLANAGVLTDVLSRLLDNAVKFVPAERQPHVRVHADNGARVRLYIEDNGIGISPEYHERIFRVFEKLHTGGFYPGTGIGLAIARKAMERMGGQIGVQSVPGKGSRFWVDLPKAQQAEDQRQEQVQWKAHAGPSSSPPQP